MIECSAEGDSWDAANMSDSVVSPRRDLPDRTLRFAADVRAFLRHAHLSPMSQDDCRQLLRSSGSVGANYLEANESLGRKGCRMHIRISCKEAKESAYWLKLLMGSLDGGSIPAARRLLLEAEELERIFGAIYRKLQ